MTNTTNYDLKKPSQTDNYNVDDFNDNADIVDAALAAHDNSMSDIKGYIGYNDTDIYGVEVDFENNSITRLAGAVGLTAGADFDSLLPWQRRRCIMAHDVIEPLAYYGEEGYTETGFLTQEISTGMVSYATGTPVNVMVESPCYWLKVVILKSTTVNSDTILNKLRIYISPEQRDGFTKVEKRYSFAYEPCIYNPIANAYETESDTYMSVITGRHKLASYAGGNVCLSGRTFDEDFLGKINAMSSMLRSGFSLMSEHALLTTQLLFLVEYASFDAQTCIGVGQSVGNTTGGTSALGNSSGVGANGAVSYRGEENLWGHRWFALNGSGDVSDIDLYGYISSFKKSASMLRTLGDTDIGISFKDVAECDGTSASPVGDMLYPNTTGFGATADEHHLLHGGQNAVSITSSAADSIILPDVVTGTISFENYGSVTFEIYPSIARQSCLNFIYLAKLGHFDGVIVDRLINDFVIQAGSYEHNHTPKDTDFEYTIKGEFAQNGIENNLSFTSRVIAWMYNSNDHDSASTEFAIYVDSTTCWDLQGKYAAFGYIHPSGTSVLQAINNASTVSERPTPEIVISSVTIDPVQQRGFAADFEFPLPNFIYSKNGNGLFALGRYSSLDNAEFTIRVACDAECTDMSE